MTDNERCVEEIALATFALVTGRDPIDGQPVRTENAVLYLTDWWVERALLEEDDPTVRSPGALPQLNAPQALALIDRFWRTQPCSVCRRRGSECSHRAPARADFVAYAAALDERAAVDVRTRAPGATLSL